MILLGFSTNTVGQEGELLGELPGAIAYVGSDYNIYRLDLTSGEEYQITDDASTRSNPVSYYRWPTWSTDGRLAYFRSTLGFDSGGRVNFTRTEAFVSGNGTAHGDIVYSGDNTVFQYAYWSPQNCRDTDNCRDLALLLSSVTDGLYVELIRVSSEPATHYAIPGNGGPFYYSWSPDGTRLLRRRASSTPLDVFDVESKLVENSLAQMPGAFQAPAWSPIDDRLLFGALNSDNRSTSLVIQGQEAAETLAADLQGPVYFSWSPNGNSVAYTDRQGPLLVLDAVTGETVSRSPTAGVLAFFWSPDSEALAYLTLADSAPAIDAILNPNSVRASLFSQTRPEEINLAWSVLDLQSGKQRRYGAFHPTGDMLYLFQYFDQFVQSHRIWSPDSTHLIYGQITDTSQPVISILDVSRSDSVPLIIKNGFLGVWSFS